MTQEVETLHRRQSITLADELMQRKHIRHLPIVDDHHRLVGLVSHRDLLAAHISSMTALSAADRSELQLSVPVDRIMVHDVWSVRPQTPAHDAAQLLLDNRFGCAPVLDDTRQVIGIITGADFLDHIIKHLESHNARLAVRELMRPDPVTLSVEQRLSEAEALMMSRHVRHLPVVDEGGALTGIVTHRDLLAARYSSLSQAPKFPADAHVSDIMNVDVWTVSPDTLASKAAHQLRDHAFGCLPVTADGKLVGVVTESDFLALLVTGRDSAAAPRAGRSTPIHQYMQSPVRTVSPDDDVGRVQQLLDGHNISSVAVVDERRKLAGVVSRTDLLRLSMPRLTARHRRGMRDLPRRQVRELMTAEVITVGLETSLGDTAKDMLEHNVHRVFVTEGERLLGVFSTTDAMIAVRNLRVDTPAAAYMTSVLFAVTLSEPLSASIKLLDRAHISGLVVLDAGWPVGVFTKREALSSRHLPRDTPTEYAMSQAFICAPARTPMYRIAGQAAALGVRRVVIFQDGHAQGVLTGMDFARACMTDTPVEIAAT
ncbi:MAG: hypothetical protein Tsb0020_37400 [Haliangiales bacterium]